MVRCYSVRTDRGVFAGLRSLGILHCGRQWKPSTPRGVTAALLSAIAAGPLTRDQARVALAARGLDVRLNTVQVLLCRLVRRGQAVHTHVAGSCRYAAVMPT